MKNYSKSTKIIATVVAILLVGGFTFFEHNVQGQNEDSKLSMNSEAAVQRFTYLQGKLVKGVELSAVLPDVHKEDYQSLEPIVVLLTLKNVSKDSIRFIETFSSKDYELAVKNSAGELMPATRYGYKGEPGEVLPSTATREVSLKPQEEKQFEVVVNRMVDMTMDDSYSIAIYRAVSLNGKLGYVKSNTLRVNVNTKDSGVGDISLPSSEPAEVVVE